MPEVASPGGERIGAAELIAALSLATDLGLGVQLKHGLHSTLIGVSTRAAAALFAMQYGLAMWGEFPIGSTKGRP